MSEHEAVTNVVEPFRVVVPEAEVDELRRRLDTARWPERETDPGQGVRLDRLQGLCERWARSYDWRRLEGRLNAVDQGRFLVDGLRIHFLHARSDQPDAVPLLLTHGWPGSVVEHLDVVEPLTRAGFHCDESGYSSEQRTRPQTVGYALTDSPVALAGWLGEKLLAWADPREPLTDEQVLDGVSVYWFTRTGASAARLYWESLGDVDRWLGGPLEAQDVVSVPTGCSVFPYELQRPTRTEAEVRFSDIRYWGTPARGGHFPAWEQPSAFVDELQGFRAAL